MNDMDKIVEIFQSGQYQLAIQLAAGIGMSDMELLMYIWENCSQLDGESNDNDTIRYIQFCYIGEFQVSQDYYVKEDMFDYVLEDINGDDYYYTSLNKVLSVILNIINRE